MQKEYQIIKCITLAAYKLGITFADGKSGTIDLNYLVGKGIFDVWNDYKEFQKVTIDPITKTVSWNNEIDLDPIELRRKLIT
jgi:hypothetical protein